MPEFVKKEYKFSFRSSLYITGVSILCILIVMWLFDSFHIAKLAAYTIIIFTVSFLLLQYRVQRFIYRRVKRIYDDVSLLESTTFHNQPITTSMGTLTREIEKIAKDKKLEIETLKIRETYRKEFMGNVSHELKTPLFTVQGYILTLLDGAMNDKVIRKKYLERAEKGVDRLIYIVKDLDMITKLEIGDLNLDYENFNIVELIEGVFEMFEMKAKKKNITLTFDTKYRKPITVYADKERIQQVMTNLVVNSIKYGREGGTTEISIENLIKNKVIVRVTDEEENIPRLFERFYRVDKSGSRKEGGSGLGLSIVKHIIEAHQQTINVRSVEQLGSTFGFTLSKG